MAATETITVTSGGRGSIVRSGFDGTVVADFNSELAGPTGYTDAYGNAWAIN